MSDLSPWTKKEADYVDPVWSHGENGRGSYG